MVIRLVGAMVFGAVVGLERELYGHGTWVDKQVVVCTEGPNTLVTSRKPDDLDAFCAAMVEAFQAGGAR